MDIIKTVTSKNMEEGRHLIKLVKHNKLVQSKYALEASEQKLLYKIFEHIQKKEYTTRELEFSFSEFYIEFKEILGGRNLTKKEFKNLVESVQNNIPYILIGDEFIRTQWYKIKGSLDYENLKLILDEDIFQYVQSLNGNFTGLRMESLYGLKSFFSMRIYELLRQWINTKTIIPYELDSLKELLGVQDKSGYNNYNNFNTKILKKSIEEINSKTELKVTYEPIKDGKKVIAINFVVIEDDSWLKFEKKEQYKPKQKPIENNSKNNNSNKKPLRFANYEQRDYDYDSLEKKLLGQDDEEEINDNSIIEIKPLGVKHIFDNRS